MSYLENPYRGRGLPRELEGIGGATCSDPADALALLSHCPAAAVTPLVTLERKAAELGIARLSLKDERGRMGLGSFKALGAAHAIARDAHRALGDALFAEDRAAGALAGQVYTAATAGNHGLSIAAGARVFGARAVIFIARTVPESFADRLRAHGAEVVRAGADYEESLAAARQAADKNGWILLSDTSWPGYWELPLAVMEGYLVMASEAADQVETRHRRPSHVFLQAGVGGLAAAVAAHLRARWNDGTVIVVVEPDRAPALMESIRAGAPVVAPGPVSNMGRLDCKEPSQLALASLARDADAFLTVSDDEAAAAADELTAAGIATSPSGGAGFAGLRAALGQGHAGLGPDSDVLLFISEGPGSA